MAIVAAAAGFGAKPKCLPAGMPRAILQMPLGELLHTVAWFGWWNSGHARESLRRLGSMKPSARIPVIEAALPVWRDWPVGFEHFLQNMRGAAPRRSRTVLTRDLGGLHAFLFYGAAAPGMEFIRESATQWLRSTQDGALLSEKATKPRGLRLATPDKVERRRWRALGQHLGIGLSATRKTALGGGLKLSPNSTQVSHSAMVTFLAKWRASMSYKEAAQLLGVPFDLFRGLLKEQAVPRDDTICHDGRRNYSIHRKAMNGLLAAIGEAVLPLTKASGNPSVVPLSNAFQTEISTFFTRKDLLDAIIAKRVTSYGDGEPGALRRLCVDVREVKAAALRAIKGDDPDLMTASEAAEWLGLCHGTIRNYAIKGKIRPRLIDAGIRKYRLGSRSDLLLKSS